MKIATIGCSFTNYTWPSYADVLQADNYGLSGIGNDRIWYTLLHLVKTNQLELYEGIVIQWTSPYRFDYKTLAGWTPNDGNIATSIQNSAIWRSIRGWYNELYEKERSENFIISAKALLKNFDIKTYHMSMTDDLDTYVDLPNLKQSFRERYQFARAPWTTQPFQDGHPTVLEHIRIAEHIANCFDISINQKIYKKCMDFHLTICETKDFAEVDRLYKLNFPNRYIAAGL